MQEPSDGAPSLFGGSDATYSAVTPGTTPHSPLRSEASRPSTCSPTVRASLLQHHRPRGGSSRRRRAKRRPLRAVLTPPPHAATPSATVASHSIASSRMIPRDDVIGGVASDGTPTPHGDAGGTHNANTTTPKPATGGSGSKASPWDLYHYLDRVRSSSRGSLSSATRSAHQPHAQQTTPTQERKTQGWLHYSDTLGGVYTPLYVILHSGALWCYTDVPEGCGHDGEASIDGVGTPMAMPHVLVVPVASIVSITRVSGHSVKRAGLVLGCGGAQHHLSLSSEEEADRWLALIYADAARGGTYLEVHEGEDTSQSALAPGVVSARPPLDGGGDVHGGKALSDKAWSKALGRLGPPPHQDAHVAQELIRSHLVNQVLPATHHPVGRHSSKYVSEYGALVLRLWHEGGLPAVAQHTADFVEELTLHTAKHFPALEQCDAGLQATRSAVEDYLFGSIHRPLWALYISQHADEDGKHASRVAELSDITPQHLLDGPRFCLFPVGESAVAPYQRAVDHLATLDALQVPHQQIECLVRTQQLIVECINEYAYPGDSGPAASVASDELLPIFTYVIIRARLSHACSIARFMQDFMSEAAGMQMEGFALATFQACLGALFCLEMEEMEENALRINEQWERIRSS